MKLKFNVGDRVFDKKYGHGVVQRVDAGNSEFPYLIFYEDGTKIWYNSCPCGTAGLSKLERRKQQSNKIKLEI